MPLIALTRTYAPGQAADLSIHRYTILSVFHTSRNDVQKIDVFQMNRLEQSAANEIEATCIQEFTDEKAEPMCKYQSGDVLSDVHNDSPIAGLQNRIQSTPVVVRNIRGSHFSLFQAQSTPRFSAQLQRCQLCSLASLLVTILFFFTNYTNAVLLSMRIHRQSIRACRK